MHYKNGREAKNGDKVARLNSAGKVQEVGILYDATPGNDYCNGRIAQCSNNDAYPNLKECLHVDDIAEVVAPAPAVAAGEPQQELQQAQAPADAAPAAQS